MRLADQLQSADWKKEKHAPVIEAPQKVKSGEAFEVKLSLGKEIAHPNTTEHHISWISLYFKPKSSNFTHQVGHFEFWAHGKSTSGPNKGPIYAHPSVSASVSLNESGTFFAMAFCNIHGLWESSLEIEVE